MVMEVVLELNLNLPLTLFFLQLLLGLGTGTAVYSQLSDVPAVLLLFVSSLLSGGSNG